MKETKGGVALSQENQSCLRFSLEESLWFRKGQEVEELVSISLDPDITIQENDQYVTIRGSLELTGEYKSYETNHENEDEGVISQKFVERVDTREEGTCEFSHRFPVDITIPNNRIQSIYDIDVLVESFDYSIPERSCLKLAAELTISGLYGTEQQQQPQEEVEEIEVVHRTQPNEIEEDVEEVEVELEAVQSSYKDSFLFEAEARKPQEEESVEVLPKFPTFNYQPQEEIVDEDNEPAWEVHAARSEESQPSWELQEARNAENQPPWYHQEVNSEETQPAWNFQEVKSEESQPTWELEEVKSAENQPAWEFQEARSESSHPEQETAEEIVSKVKPAPTAHVEGSQVEESSSSSEEAPPKNVKKKKPAKKKSMTLTEFFARKDESSEQARVKICIVQKGDTVDTVAGRYDVSVQNLLRVNNLEINQDVFEGQVLYIPSSPVKK
ncbi:stage VI sporulation protein D [Bacillus sp. sid0103]|uniref:stage VI sporulation protein D n=1 Tax=Bacillus sp. sid0103 TaxID=2856337 RepID=UPI0027DF56E0|nr:stage VI sporulation protein D [Bacillus sp. sid0103]